MTTMTNPLDRPALEMTVRDVIAAHILGGFAANQREDCGVTVVEVARAYNLADDCLKARLGQLFEPEAKSDEAAPEASAEGEDAATD